MSQALIQLYRQMGELTEPQCGRCRAPYSCCSPEYCDMAIQFAAESWGVVLTPTGHPTLPLMGLGPSGEPVGCTAPPHVRPLCTLHACAINGLGTFKDAALDEEYYTIRSRIEQSEYERMKEHGS